jgi:hypothetical protein
VTAYMFSDDPDLRCYRPTLRAGAGFCGACGRLRPLWTETDGTATCEDCFFERTGLDILVQGENYVEGSTRARV